MAKKSDDTVLDAPLDLIKSTADRLFFLNAEPADYAEAVGSCNIGTKEISSTDFTGPADKASGGRELTVNAVGLADAVPVATPGTQNHVGLGNSSLSKLLHVTTCGSKTYAAGDFITMDAWDISFSDPA